MATSRVICGTPVFDVSPTRSTACFSPHGGDFAAVARVAGAVETRQTDAVGATNSLITLSFRHQSDFCMLVQTSAAVTTLAAETARWCLLATPRKTVAHTATPTSPMIARQSECRPTSMWHNSTCTTTCFTTYLTHGASHMASIVLQLQGCVGRA
jgi:hypothetical protein